MGFCSVPGVDKVCHAAGGATKAVAGSAFQAVVDAFAKGLASVMKALMTFWIHTPEPDVSSSSSVITTLDGLTRPLVAFCAVGGLIVGGMRLAWTARGDQSGRSILRGLLLMAAVTAAGATIVEAWLTGFDLLAVSILNNGFDGKSVGDRLLVLGALPAGTGGGLIFLLAFFGMIASLVQVGVMLVRGAILAVLVGVLPVAAASSITEAGFSWFKRLCGWIVSFTLYKLVAAVIYAAAFTMIGNATDLAGIVSGFALIIVAILALPALLRLIPPSAEAMGGGGGGALAGAAAAAATGAVALSGKGKAGGSSSGAASTASPGLAGGGGPSGSSSTSGGKGSLPPGGGPSGAPGGAAGGSGAAGAGAASGAAAAGGPVGAGVAVAQRVHAGAKSAANNAAGDSEGAS